LNDKQLSLEPKGLRRRRPKEYVQEAAATVELPVVDELPLAKDEPKSE
jgi:hypothetical protein